MKDLKLNNTLYMLLGVTECPAPTNILNMVSYTPSTGPYTTEENNTVTYACVIGYKIVGSNTITCQANGTWTTKPSCEETHCTNPGLIDNMASFQPITGPYTPKTNNVVVYTCTTESRMVGRSRITCQNNGNWTTGPECLQIACPNPTNITNMASFIPSSGPYTPLSNNVVTYTCNAGYKIHGTATITCQESETWTRTPQCQEIVCPNPLNISNMASFTPNSEPYTPISNNNVTYICAAGYKIDGSATITCQDSGKWTTNPQCQQIVCPNPPNIFNMASFTPNTGPYTPISNNVVTYTCNAGNKINGSVTITCQESGNWTTFPKCLPIICPNPPNITHMANFTSDFGPYSPISNNVVTYTCNAGYNIYESATITCQESETWTRTPQCQEIGIYDIVELTYAIFKKITNPK
uniref:Sushi, von Willebrand factor type A, EGF and pentraxin domain-containing protein 1-like n=1 Tax=Phallusia mammillata TaxID=59560 RepID=A0A6F9DTG0_9ASCI|nr:sushi, von Willebrand factor type A, EGF and pentraxin domain-containing protein 1-like [Phallusia mammillata]